MRTSTRAPSSEARRAHSALSAAPRIAPARAGFTLLELAVVLFVFGIAASFLIPRLRNADSAALGASAARLASSVQYLYEEAAFRQTPMRLNFDLDRRAYWVTVLSDDPETPEFVPDASPLARPVVLPEAVAFADVVLPAVGAVKEGVVFAQFLPEGYADALVVHLVNRRSEYATLAIDSLTGRTRVGEGYVDLGRRPGMREPPDAARPEAAGRESRDR